MKRFCIFSPLHKYLSVNKVDGFLYWYDFCNTRIQDIYFTSHRVFCYPLFL